MEKTTKTPETKAKKRLPSSIYTLKSFKKTLFKLETLKMVTEDELKTLKALNNKITERWISIEMF